MEFGSLSPGIDSAKSSIQKVSKNIDRHPSTEGGIPLEWYAVFNQGITHEQKYIEARCSHRRRI